MEPEEGNGFKQIITEIVRRNTKPEIFVWLEEKADLIREEKRAFQLNLVFASIPKKTGRHLIELTPGEKQILQEVHEKFSINEWTIDKLSRLWLLMQLNATEKNDYHTKIENLFKAAEMNELAALYSSLYFLDYHEEWKKQCSEGVRSNIGIVLEAIMYNNPYPFKYLDDLAWNQLVLKAFFTEKDVKRIIGLDERANKELAWILIDYANERSAAHRTVNPQLWRLVSKFIDERNIVNIEKAFKSVDIKEKQAVALACFASDYLPAKNLLENEPELKSNIMENKLNWNAL